MKPAVQTAQTRSAQTRSAQAHRAIRLAGALSLLLALPGCIAVAAIAVPAMTATGVATEKKRDQEPPETNLPAPQVSPGPSFATQPVVQPAPASNTALALPSLAIAPEKMAPTIAPPAIGSQTIEQQAWQNFFTFVIKTAEQRASGEQSYSAILPPVTSAIGLPQRAICHAAESAVLIDLDLQGSDFAPTLEMQAAPGLAEGLAGLRAQGVVIMWISQLPPARVDDIARVLVDTQLDPTGRDPILLSLREDDRKQVMRQEADETACVVAMAGDDRADFDELFDFLRNPDDSKLFDELIGAGWFLVPGPFAAPAAPEADLADAASQPAGSSGQISP